jgi:hypothetical protein
MRSANRQLTLAKKSEAGTQIGSGELFSETHMQKGHPATG